ncbi:DNA gyrase inhibitor YacG [Acuticoccus sp. M5D2P5]|uniref:DNA gyrase inhibitor YacG n=1 Tax=Acuticoccus kalidii TaxID=2910977 RepID=UPI001F460023|nr:DNA gyrase inhibitor YacG [Acuticoccus kalidii]MCF3933935.1 DNA gyrase inhibitor YacG [Acuticoccus kalidii]
MSGAQNDNIPGSTGKPCPICGKPAMITTRPFCSKRCKDVDLHRWLGGHYAIPVVEEDTSAVPDTEEDER